MWAGEEGLPQTPKEGPETEPLREMKKTVFISLISNLVMVKEDSLNLNVHNQ